MEKTIIVLGMLATGYASAQSKEYDGRVGINTEEPQASLEIRRHTGLPSGSAQGVMFPKLSIAERGDFNLSDKQIGLMIFNTDNKCLEMYFGKKGGVHQWSCINGPLATTRPITAPPTTTPVYNMPSTIALSSGTHWLVSVYDNNYLPYSKPSAPATWSSVNITDGRDLLIDIKTKITTTGIDVYIPVSSVTGSGTLPQYTSIQKILPETNKQKKEVELSLSWEDQRYDTDTQVIKAKLKASEEIDLTQLDLILGAGNDNKGVRLAEFIIPRTSIENQSNNYTGRYDVRVTPGIPDRKFGGRNHNFVYLPVEVRGLNGYKKTWLNMNLGAEYAKIGPNFNLTVNKTGDIAHKDKNLYGSLFQWQRPADGHEFRNSTTTDTQWTGSWIPNHNQFIVGTPNWTSVGIQVSEKSGDNLWKSGGANNPCPEGYHVPTILEWQEFYTEVKGLWLQDKLPNWPAAGFRSHTKKVLIPEGKGLYWSSSAYRNIHKSNFIVFDQFNINQLVAAIQLSGDRADGLPIRCIQD